jgi:hemerythrin
MTFMSWRKDYEVGVAQIDAEHRNLFDLINASHAAYARGETQREIAYVLNRLTAYAEEHFQHEEKLMRDNGYPQLDAHHELHSALVLSIFAINERLAADTVMASKETAQFLKSWLLDHILKHDMDIGDFLRRKSVQAAKAFQDMAAEKPSVKAAPGPGRKNAETGDAE